jgi:SSS family solute:Na+ symporter
MHILNWIDWSCIGLYFILVFGVAWWVSRRETHVRDDPTGYFLAGRNTGWFVIGASLFASNIGSEHLVGLAGSGAATGVAMGHFEVAAAFCLLILGWIFVPFYLKSGVFTMPEFLERRYSKAARWYLAVVSIISYVLTKISVTIIAGGLVFETLMGIDFWTGAIVVVVATGIYTIFGGLRAVLYTDLLQTFILIGGSALVTIIGLAKLGGWNAMLNTAEPEFFNLWKSASHPDFPWTGIVFGVPILGIWYWCTDQFIVQRVLAARNEKEAKLGTIFAGYLKILPLFIFVLPGIIAHCLAKTGQLQLSEADHALPVLVSALLPVGVRGIVVAGLLAALMSSLSSVFNSCSTLITWDVYKQLNPNASEKRLVLVGEISTAVLVCFGLLWIPLIKLLSKGLYHYLQSVQAYISPPIAAVFLIGLFYSRVNGRGAIASLLTGFVLGSARLIGEIFKDNLGGFARFFVEINFLHFAVILFLVCSAILILVSLTDKEPDNEQLEGVCMNKSLNTPLVATIIMIMMIAAIYIYFR